MRRIRSAACLGALLLMAVAWVPAAKSEQSEKSEQPLPDTWYVTAVTTVGSRVQFTRYWSKGARFRAESIIAGHPLVSIVNGDTYYSLDVVRAAGLAVKRDPKAIAADARRSRPFADEWQELVRAGGESVGTESIQGRESEIFRLTNSTGRRTVWVSVGEPRVPVRVETFDRRSGREEVVEYVDWLRDLVIADSFFEPSEKTHLMWIDYLQYTREIRRGPVGPVPVLYRRFLQAEWED